MLRFTTAIQTLSTILIPHYIMFASGSNTEKGESDITPGGDW